MIRRFLNWLGGLILGPDLSCYHGNRWSMGVCPDCANAGRALVVAATRQDFLTFVTERSWHSKDVTFIGPVDLLRGIRRPSEVYVLHRADARSDWQRVRDELLNLQSIGVSVVTLNEDGTLGVYGPA